MAKRKIYSKEIAVLDKSYNFQGEYDRVGNMYSNKIVKRGLADSFEVRDAFEDGMATILNMSIEKITELKQSKQ